MIFWKLVCYEKRACIAYILILRSARRSGLCVDVVVALLERMRILEMTRDRPVLEDDDDDDFCRDKNLSAILDART